MKGIYKLIYKITWKLTTMKSWGGYGLYWKPLIKLRTWSWKLMLNNKLNT